MSSSDESSVSEITWCRHVSYLVAFNDDCANRTVELEETLSMSLFPDACNASNSLAHVIIVRKGLYQLPVLILFWLQLFLTLTCLRVLTCAATAT